MPAALCCLLLLTLSVAAQRGVRAKPTATRERKALARKLEEFVTRNAAYGFSGTVLVAERGQVLLHKAYGYADRAKRIPNTTATVFPLASIGKQFTAAAIFKLESEGKLNTSDSISKYLHHVPQAMAAITIAQLLTHSAGISHEADNHLDNVATRDEFVAAVLRVPLQSRPGEKYSYSNAGYSLLATIVEEVTGRTYETYVRKELLGPANLYRTGWRSEFDSREFARGYQDAYRTEGSEVTFPPSGVLVSTVEDLYRWNEALYTDHPLTAAARNKLFTPAFDEYVNGWYKTKTKLGDEVILGDGHTPGYDAQIVRFPARRIAMAFLINNDAGWGRPLYEGLRDILFGQKYEMPPAVTVLGQQQLAKYSGKYQLPSSATLEVRFADGALLIDGFGQEAVSLLAGSEPSSEVKFAAANAQTVELIEHLKKGDFDWVKSITKFETPAPLERLRHFWDTMISSKGNLKKFHVVGTTLLRTGQPQTFIRFDLERGTELWYLLRREGKLSGWDINVDAPSPTPFLPISPTEFASFEIATGRITRIRFSIDEAGRVVALGSGVVGNQTEAKRIE
jgi:CubicO group peptidase (beta-lactamase class C family)